VAKKFNILKSKMDPDRLSRVEARTRESILKIWKSHKFLFHGEFPDRDQSPPQERDFSSWDD